MAKKPPARTWSFVLSLGLPLAVVGVSAMAISYATLIDVARVNGLPLPELFPVLVDVGTVACMIAAAQFRLRGMSGRWLAYTTFLALSVVSIVANASHAWRAADMTVTTPWAAALLASTPPFALLAITHLVMLLIPDEKERAKLNSLRERSAHEPTPTRAEVTVPLKTSPAVTQAVEVAARREPEPAAVPPLRLVAATTDRDEVRARVLEFVAIEGRRPTGAVVGEWLGGKSAKTGQRLLSAMEKSGELDEETAGVATSSQEGTSERWPAAMNVGGGQ